MWKYSQKHLFYNNFQFEVPLEDLYSSNSLHPKIKQIYDQATTLFMNNNVTLDVLLSDQNENPQKRVELREELLRKHPKMEGTPGSFMWLIEHFLGLLPIPLLAPYINGYNFKWLHLSQECKRLLKDKKSTLHFEHLDHYIQNEILKLPDQHKLLLNEQIEFMRSISFLNKGKKKKCVVYYSEYFTASLLIRPFRSGLSIKSEKDYYFLIIYLVLRWSHIRKIFMESFLLMSRGIANMQIFPERTETQKTLEKKKVIKLSSTFQSDSKYCQNIFTDMKELSSIHSDTSNSDVIVSPQARLYKNSSGICSDKVSNNENFYSQLVKKSEMFEEIKHEAKKDEESLRNEIILDEKDTDKRSLRNLQIVECCIEAPNLQKNIRESPKDNQDEHKVQKPTASVEIKENNTQLQHNSLKKLKNEESSKLDLNFKNTERIDIDDNEILKRVSKMGWTYTPPKISDEHLSKNNVEEKSGEVINYLDLEDSECEANLKKYPETKSLKSRLSFLKMGKKKSNDCKISNTNFKYIRIHS